MEVRKEPHEYISSDQSGVFTNYFDTKSGEELFQIGVNKNRLGRTFYNIGWVTDTDFPQLLTAAEIIYKRERIRKVCITIPDYNKYPNKKGFWLRGKVGWPVTVEELVAEAGGDNLWARFMHWKFDLNIGSYDAGVVFSNKPASWVEGVYQSTWSIPQDISPFHQALLENGLPEV